MKPKLLKPFRVNPRACRIELGFGGCCPGKLKAMSRVFSAESSREPCLCGLVVGAFDPHLLLNPNPNPEPET